MESDANKALEAARRGDEVAAARLIELFYERIYAFLRRLSGNEADAGDLTQRTFGRLWRALPTFAGRSSVSSWIHSIAHHVYVDWRRSNHRNEARSDDWWAVCAAPGPTPDEVAAGNDLRAAIYNSVDRLELDLRDTVHLHYYQGLTLEETAEVMGIATSTVKYRLRQALGRLQDEFAAEHLQAKRY